MAAKGPTRFLCALVLIYFALRPSAKRMTLGQQVGSIGCMDSVVSVYFNIPRLRFSKNCGLRASALVVLLLLGGDIESNPSPPCATCSGQFQQVSSRTVCDYSSKGVHTHCTFQVPEANSSYCKSCFWIL